MFLSVIGLIIIGVTSAIGKANPNLGGIVKTGRLIGIALIVLGLLTACFVQIPPGTVGVQTLFGKVQPGILTEGLNMVNPMVDVVDYDVKTQNYTMSAVHDEGDQEGDDAIRVLTADGLEVVIDLSVLYHIIPEKSPDILRSIGRDIKSVIVRPVSRTKIRDNAVFYDAVALYSTKR
ncbi:MAG: SPFH domain-containing protein, partial [Saprospiraceae bacterium]